MKYPFIKFAFDRKGRASSSKPGTIDLEVTFEGKQKRFSTKVQVLPSQWDKSGQIINHPDAVFLNQRLSAFRKPIDYELAKLMMAGEPFSFSWLDSIIARQKLSGSFRKFVESSLESRNDLQLSTIKNHRTLVAALRSFGKLTSFNDVTQSTIKMFDAWLHEKGYTQTTIHKYHSMLKSYVHMAMDLGFLAKDPYAGFMVARGQYAERRYLTEEELHKIMTMEIADPSVSRARDLFIFQAFTGLAYSDMQKFDFTKTESREGRVVLRDVRKKTGSQFYIVLLTPALKVLEKYNFKLPLISNQKYNSALKALGLHINKHITSHCARHTFATWCLNKNVNIEVLAKLMGHQSSKSTRIYADIVNKTIEDTFDMLESKI